MGMHRSQLEVAADQALDQRLAVERILHDGQVTPAEQIELLRHARTVQAEIEAALAFRRCAESIERIGMPNPYVVRTFSRWMPWLRFVRGRKEDGGAQVSAA